MTSQDCPCNRPLCTLAWHDASAGLILPKWSWDTLVGLCWLLCTRGVRLLPHTGLSYTNRHTGQCSLSKWGFVKSSSLKKKKKILFIFREKGRRKEEKHQCVVAPHTPSLGTWPATQTFALDWESNQWSLVHILHSIHWATAARMLKAPFNHCQIVVESGMKIAGIWHFFLQLPRGCHLPEKSAL